MKSPSSFGDFYFIFHFGAKAIDSLVSTFSLASLLQAFLAEICESGLS